MADPLKIVSPIDGKIIAEREPTSVEQIRKALQCAITAQSSWCEKPVSERAVYCRKAIDWMLANADELGREIALQMGRPIQYAAGEIRGLHERGQAMIDIAEQSLETLVLAEKPGFNRFIRREPLGLVFTIAPWNYPYLTAVNSIIPALMAGNAVLLKHSVQTMLCAERFSQGFQQAGLPEGLFQHLHLDHHNTGILLKQKELDFVTFTGSVAGGSMVENALAGSFKSSALELGGKDPAYVREDADVSYAVENLVDGAFFNSGQSCCAVERIYVDQHIFKDFVDLYIAQVKQYQLGDPLDPATTLGPLVNTAAVQRVKTQIDQAVSLGAQSCIDDADFSNSDGLYFAPQVLLNVDHSMEVMSEESFGPVIGIMAVNNDEEALHYMNDSPYGLTASIWTRDETKAIEMGAKLQTGTVFMNRCDYLDPALAWVGVKNSGRGCALSSLGYEQLTRPKSFHLKCVE